MSYSFSVLADTKDEAGKRVEEQLALVVRGQPGHDFDRQAAQDAAEAFVEILAEPREGECVIVTVYGSMNSSSSERITSASVSVNVCIEAKAAT